MKTSLGIVVPETPYTKQTLFEHLLEWASCDEGDLCKEKDICDDWVCRYRSKDDSNACWIGSIMPDSYYNDNVCENKSADYHFDSLYELGVFDKSVSRVFLGALQNIHDTADTKEAALKALVEYGIDLNLNIPEGYFKSPKYEQENAK